MKFHAAVSILLVCAFYASADQDASPLVVNGEDARIEDYPYMAKVWTLNFPLCGGAILTTRSVLTVRFLFKKCNRHQSARFFQAAHCLIARISQPFAVTVVVGSSYRRGQGGSRHAAARIVLHPEYVAGPNIYDVAVIRTLTRFMFSNLVQPIPLSDRYIPEGTLGVFTGWGAVSYGILPRRGELLQKMNFRTISNELCAEMYSVTHRGDYVFDQKLCILSGQRTSVCSGDSGSPLVVDGTVVGVTSWRTMPCGGWKFFLNRKSIN